MSISGCESFCLDCNKLSTLDHAPSTLIYLSLGICPAADHMAERERLSEIKITAVKLVGKRGGKRLTNARAVIFMIACCLFA